MMRINLKPAAATATAISLLFLIFHLTWPGHGAWLLVIGLLTAIASAALYWRERTIAQSGARSDGYDARASIADVGPYGLTGSAMRQSAARRASEVSSGVPLWAVLAPISALSLLLFIGGALGASEPETSVSTPPLQQSVTAIDRSRDGEPAQPAVDPPSAPAPEAQQSALSQANNATADNAAAQSPTSQQAVTPVRPIVVSAPRAASHVDEESDAADGALAPESAATFEYTVEDGDTLYDIAERYESTVEAIMNLNQLDQFSYIHPGDILRIPIASDEDES